MILNEVIQYSEVARSGKIAPVGTIDRMILFASKASQSRLYTFDKKILALAKKLKIEAIH